MLLQCLQSGRHCHGMKGLWTMSRVVQVPQNAADRLAQWHQLHGNDSHLRRMSCQRWVVPGSSGQASEPVGCAAYQKVVSLNHQSDSRAC